MRNKINSFLIVLFLSIFVILVSCGQKKIKWQGTIEVVDSVTVIKNPKEPMYGEEVFSLKEELSLGEAEGRAEYMFSLIRDIAVDEEERIYILDYRESHIKVFDKNGEYLKTIGRKGQGPGEMNRPGGIIISPKKEILVNNGHDRGLLFFTLEGKFIKVLSLVKLRGFSRPRIDSHGNIVAGYLIWGRTVTSKVKKFDPELKEIFTIFSTEVAKPPIVNPFSPGCYWEVIKGNNIIWAYSDKYELKVLNPDGKIIRKIVRDYSPKKITEEEKEKYINDMFGERGVPPDVKFKWTKYHNAFIELSIDDEGRIFLRSYDKIPGGKGYYYDVFDSDGKYIARIPLEMQPLIWKKNKLYTIEDDEEGYQVVKRYKVIWRY